MSLISSSFGAAAFEATTLATHGRPTRNPPDPNPPRAPGGPPGFVGKSIGFRPVPAPPRGIGSSSTPEALLAVTQQGSTAVYGWPLRWLVVCSGVMVFRFAVAPVAP